MGGKGKRCTVTGYAPSVRVHPEAAKCDQRGRYRFHLAFLPIVQASSCLVSGQVSVQWDTVPVSHPFRRYLNASYSSITLVVILLLITIIIGIVRRFVLTIEIAAVMLSHVPAIGVAVIAEKYGGSNQLYTKIMWILH